MTVENIDRTVTTAGPTPSLAQTVTPVSTAHETVTTNSRTSTASPGRPELGRRIVVLVFGLIQVVIGARFILLLLDAREANGLVSGILNLSQIFVAPFEGILRTNALHAGGSTFDVAAIVAIVGWTVLELIVIWAIGIFRREKV
jgi:YGGT family